MLAESEELDSCPKSVEATPTIIQIKPGVDLSYRQVAVITAGVDLGVTIEPEHTWGARIDALGVSVCTFDLKGDMDLFDLLELHAVGAATEIVDLGFAVGDGSLSVAIRILALSKTGELRSTLEREATVADHYADL